MKHLILACLLAGGMVAAAADDDDSKKLLKEIEGTYRLVSIEKAGEAPPKEFFDKIEKIAIRGDKFTITFKDGGKAEEKSATITIDARKKPFAIDLKPDEENVLVPGIISYDNNLLRICWADKPPRDAKDAKADRPTEFKTTKENRQFMITMAKVKTK